MPTIIYIQQYFTVHIRVLYLLLYIILLFFACCAHQIVLAQLIIISIGKHAILNLFMNSYQDMKFGGNAKAITSSCQTAVPQCVSLSTMFKGILKSKLTKTND